MFLKEPVNKMYEYAGAALTKRSCATKFQQTKRIQFYNSDSDDIENTRPADNN